MIEIYQSVELTWGAPDLALYESLPHSIRQNGGKEFWRAQDMEERKEAVRNMGRANAKPLLYMGLEFESCTAASAHFDVCRRRIVRDIQNRVPGCRYL